MSPKYRVFIKKNMAILFVVALPNSMNGVK